MLLLYHVRGSHINPLSMILKSLPTNCYINSVVTIENILLLFAAAMIRGDQLGHVAFARF